MKISGDERGVTLLELLGVLALLGLVFGGVLAFSTTTLRQFRDTTQGSQNQAEASQILSDLAQDLQRSAATDIWQEASDHKYHLHTTRPNDASQKEIEVAYEQVGTEIRYSRVQNGQEVTLTLTSNGSFHVVQAGDVFTIVVTVGEGNGANRAELTTKVSRYNWGR